MRFVSSAWLRAVFWAPALLLSCGSAETVSNDVPPPQCPPIVEDDSLTVPAPPDGAAACPTGDCNYQTQDGCSAQLACRPQFDATDATVVPGCESAGKAATGEACADQGDCVRGAYCALGVCRKLCCDADWTGCDAGESCIRALDLRAGGQVISTGVELCFPVNDCDLFDPHSCDSDPTRECKIVDPTGAVACAPRSLADVGDACAPPSVCKQGLNCVGGYCAKLCAALACAEPSCSEADGSCVHFQRDPADVGECTLGR
jgi:hypothetical protein